MTRRVTLILAFGVCSALTVVSYGASKQGTWTGYVTDTHCGTHCQVTSRMKPDLNCIRLCVKKGSKYGLWSGHHVYVLQPQAKAASFAAENVQVKGLLQGDTIQIVSIEQRTHAGHSVLK